MKKGYLLGAAAFLAVSLSSLVNAQTCVDRSQADSADIKVGAAAICPAPTTGNTTYEQLIACGYHPQRKEAACRVDIKQHAGYGAAGYQGAGGSMEYVTFCIQDPVNLSWSVVNINGFHVNNSTTISGSPPWSFGVSISANVTLFQRALNRQSLNARAFLSWNTPHNSCTTLPMWGNYIPFNIRLDP